MDMWLGAGRELVAIPGPTVVPDRVLSAMHRAMPDIYAGELTDVIDEVFDALPGVARTASRPFVTISNGHGAWEMALSNTLSRGDRVLVLECGRFGTVWGEMAQFNGLRVEAVTADTGRAVDPAAVEEHLRRDAQHEITAILVVHVDTASSIRNDLPAIRAAIDAAGHPALLMVDCIASLACERYEMDAWGVDVTVAASQKGLMTPPGLGFVWAGPRALAAHQSADLRTRYWDWTSRTENGPYYLRFCGTPPVTHLYGIREALRMVGEEGLEARWHRHTALAAAVHAAVDAWSTPGGLSLHATDPAERANAVTTIRAGAIDADRLRSICRDDAGVTLGIGVGDVAGPAFRIGHMGHVNVPMVLGVIGTIEAALGAMRAPTGGSGVAAASAALADVL
ncbi:MAG: aminotransferase class V-fold PLP-dependent enzyme [Ilumatobacter sp.]|nr:aminotransferase class V-fold PLP-dependent enzyme [Ilumatobacter sp.]MDJ0771519.1 aminotransferase class V-fold PLP-dependent enzyme [Ilumatobacter sp.]